jgi:streptomycin 6-kinase
LTTASFPWTATLIIPPTLIAACRNRPKREKWLAQLPHTVHLLQQQWSLALEAPFEIASAAWVAPAKLADGTFAVLKVAMPHVEGDHEIDGLRFWQGSPTVQLLQSDPKLCAMLLERCDPGEGLWKRPRSEQDLVLAGILQRLWRMPPAPHPFRQLSAMLAGWKDRTLAHEAQWPDVGLVQEGLRLLADLAATATDQALLATDLHAGNVLSAHREPWLVIDPRPYIGDPAYDATQHLLNRAGAGSDAAGTIHRFAQLAGLDPERVRLWTFARAAAQPRDDWSATPLFELAQAIAP